VRVFISYAWGDREHEELVRGLWLFLRANGIDARLDLPASEERRDWVQWMSREVRDADRIVVVASSGYKLRAEGDAEPDEGRGVQFESWLIRQRFYADPAAGVRLVLPVLLAGCSAADIPFWLGPDTATHYVVREFTLAGAEALVRALTGQPGEVEPPLGAVPYLPPRGQGAAARVALRTEVLIEAALDGDGRVVSAVSLGGSPLCQRTAPLPPQVAGVWSALALPPLVASDRMVAAGRALAGTLLDEQAQRLLAEVADRLPPGDTVEVVLAAAGPVLSLPVELIRLAADGGEVGPLGLVPGVSVCRRPAARAGDGTGGRAPVLAGPLKVLVAVAAPDETKTASVPLDAEAEMQAVLDAVADVAGGPQAQVRILEVASLAQIRQALQRDGFHVLHLSAHGSARAVELEDEDGNPVPVTAEALMGALRQAGRPVPLIVLSSCSGGSAASQAMAEGLIARGGDRVIAMLAPVTDGYATVLARRLYQELAARPELTVGQALASARGLAEEDRARDSAGRLVLPEYGVAALLAAAQDGPLIDPAAQSVPLTVMTLAPGGASVRELPLGTLIGRRAQLRAATSVLRREPKAVRRFGAASGVILTGIGGIGKTAVAGRIMARLREDGWLIAVHDGRWNPTALIAATAAAIAEAMPRVTDPVRTNALGQVGQLLADPGQDDAPKLAVVRALLAGERLLLVFDDFEQNLTTGGQDFADPAIADALDALAGAARTGKLLITCRYPLPGPDRFLAEVPIPALSAAELRRMFLRLPALADLAPADRRLLTRTIGGHPRLIELTDALLRGGRSDLYHVQEKLRDLAHNQGINLGPEPSVGAAVDQAMILGGADILLSELLTLLTPGQAAILAQVAVCRAPMALDDLAFTLTPDPPDDPEPSSPAAAPPDRSGLHADTSRLADLTLLSPGEQIGMHPWTAALVTRNTHTGTVVLHERALAMRMRRFQQNRGTIDDLLDIPRHLAALHRWDDIAGIAEQATRVLPGTLATVAYLAETRPLIPPEQRAWILVADFEVQALLAAGDLPAATRQLQLMHQQVEARAAADPGNADWRRDLSVSHERLGNVAVAAGDLATARTHYQASLDIREQLAAADPSNTDWQRDLSVSRNKLGDMAVAAGDLATAATNYQASLDIAERLAAADPSNTEWQRDVSVSRNKLGDMAVAAGDLAAAATNYQASLDIRERLAAADPTNTGWQRDLAVCHERLGDVAVDAGDLATAATHHQARLDIAERLAAADPTNTEWQRNLSVSRNKLGDVAGAAGDLATAATHYQAGLDIAERLAAADPTNTGWQRDLSVSHERLGDVAGAAGDLTAAATHHQASLDIAERLAAADPTNTEWQRDLAVSHERLGDVAGAAGDLTAAATNYQASLDIRERLAAADPTNTEWQRDVSVSRNKLGDVAVDAGDLATAAAHYQASLDIRERLAAADPTNTRWQRDLSVTHERLGDVAVDAGDLATAAAHYQASLDIRERLAAADPTNTRWQRDLSTVRQKIADLGGATDA
jgi:tetratricopeptide (TPR) repeat protein